LVDFDRLNAGLLRNKIKQCRRVATRYDKLAANYLAFIKLASIRIWLRANESAP
jgi:transposase